MPFPLCTLPNPAAGGWDKNSSTVGKHATSWLVQTVAMEGMADAFMSFNTNYHDTGLFGVYGKRKEMPHFLSLVSKTDWQSAWAANTSNCLLSASSSTACHAE